MPDIPIAISRLGEDDSREAQNLRAVTWLLAQSGGPPVVVVTPRRSVRSESIAQLIARPMCGTTLGADTAAVTTAASGSFRRGLIARI